MRYSAAAQYRGLSRSAEPTPPCPDSAGAGAPASELDVTPALRAAWRVLAENYMGDGIYDVREAVLAQIYRAMHEAY